MSASTFDSFRKPAFFLMSAILSKITEEKWEVMSKNCYEWYQKNVHSKNVMTMMLNNILYK